MLKLRMGIKMGKGGWLRLPCSSGLFFMEKNNVTVEKATQAYISELRAIIKAEAKKETVSERIL